MRASSFLPVLLSLGLVAACDAGTLQVEDPPDRSGPDAGQQNPAADADVGGGPLEARVQGADLLYHFAGGVAGQTIVDDVSGQTPPHPLQIDDPLAITWGLSSATITAPTIITNLNPATRVRDACAATGAVTVEAWVRTGDLEQNGRIATFSLAGNNLNVSLRQEGPDYYTYLRTIATNAAGDPALVRGPIDAVNMQHFVYTKDVPTQNGTQTVYLNNTPVDLPLDKNGSLANWDGLFQFAIGAEIGNQNNWLGEIALVAVYCKMLTPAEVAQNFNAGY